MKKVADGCVSKINRGETKQSFTFSNSCILPEGAVHKMGPFLNQVFIFLEDSFNTFFKRMKKVADGCVSKINRGETKQSFTFSNSCILPEGVVHKMGPFLKPLIDEAKMHYVEGFDVRIQIKSNIFSQTQTLQS